MFGLSISELSAALPGLMQGLGVTLKLLAFGVIGGIDWYAIGIGAFVIV